MQRDVKKILNLNIHVPWQKKQLQNTCKIQSQTAIWSLGRYNNKITANCFNRKCRMLLNRKLERRTRLELPNRHFKFKGGCPSFHKLNTLDYLPTLDLTSFENISRPNKAYVCKSSRPDGELSEGWSTSVTRPLVLVSTGWTWLGLCGSFTGGRGQGVARHLSAEAQR